MDSPLTLSPHETDKMNYFPSAVSESPIPESNSILSDPFPRRNDQLNNSGVDDKVVVVISIGPSRDESMTDHE